MRLDVLEHGHKLPSRLFQRVAALAFRAQLDDVAKTMMHRPEFWGRPFAMMIGQVMRGESYWTPAEREYMAAVTSRLNECPFCARVHAEVTRVATRGEIEVDDPTSARPELAAVLQLLEKVTTTPDGVTSADIDAVRGQGVPDEAIVDALHVNLIFNALNRMANAFDWSWDSDKQVQLDARVLHRLSYHLPGFVLR